MGVTCLSDYSQNRRVGKRADSKGKRKLVVPVYWNQVKESYYNK